MTSQVEQAEVKDFGKPDEVREFPIGDDRIQMQSRGYVAPESFTHGSSAERVQGFRRGIESGELGACDTFAAGSP